MPDLRPNIIFIITDQQRYDTIAALGFPYVDTPHLDRLAREGIVFTNCFITGASCAPSRASLFSGTYPHTAGVMRNGDVWRACWVQELANAGYHCVNVGKMHTYPFEAAYGFNERYVVENKDRYLEGRYYFDRWDMAFAAHGLTRPGREVYRTLPDYKERLGAVEWSFPEHLHSDVFVGRLAAWWVEHKPKTEPLFLQVGFPGPHPPYDPIPRHLAPYLNRDLPLPQVTQEEMDALPPPLKELRVHNTGIDHDSIVWQLDPTPEQLHRLRAHYLANVSMIDEQVGALLAALEAQGYLEDAVVIFTSDHGDCLGDHGQIQKWTMYDVITRVPLIVWTSGEGRKGGEYKGFGGGRRVDDLWQQMDLAPALMELASVPVPESWEAISMLPALRGDAGAAGRQVVFAEQSGDNALTGADLQTMVRTRDWKLVHYLDQPDGELYDLHADPGECVNLWSHIEQQAKKQELLDALLSWRSRSAAKPRRTSLITH